MTIILTEGIYCYIYCYSPHHIFSVFEGFAVKYFGSSKNL